MHFGIERPAVFERLASNKRFGLCVIKSDLAAKFVHTQQFAEMREPRRCLADKHLKKRQIFFVLLFDIRCFRHVSCLHSHQFLAVVGPQSLHLGLQGLYRFIACCDLLFQCVYLLLLPLDFRRADHRADTVEDGRADLGGGVLQLLGSQLSFYRFQFRFGLFFGYPGFLGLLLLLGEM